MRLRSSLAVLAALTVSTSAWAGDDVFRLDPVFVSVYRSPDADLKERARAIERRLALALSQRHLVIPLDEVKPFEDYSAEIYLDSCADGREAGCAYVIGDRAGADWAVSGVVESVLGEDAVVVETTIVDVRESRAVVRFQVRLDDDDVQTYANAVADLIDRLAKEGTAPRDVREDPTGEGAVSEEARREAEKQVLSASLDALESELGSLEVRERNRAVEAPKLTADDIKAYEDAEAAAPWERFGMTADQYRRMRNAGQDAASWKQKLRGRAGKVLIRAGISGGRGPWEVDYDGRWVIDASTTNLVEVDTFQQVVAGPGWGADLEVGLGITPWLDVAGTVSSRVGPFQWLFHQETLGDARIPRDVERLPVGSAFVGGRVNFAPFPTSMVRPTGGAGLGLWFGPGLGRVVDLSSVPAVEALPPARVVVLRLGPGVEVEASSQIQVYGRLEGVLPLIGSGTKRWGYGEPNLVHRGEPLALPSTGIGATVGVQVALGPLWGGAPASGSR